MIKLKAIRFQYRDGDFSLNIPELHIAGGDKVAVVGPSGSGKTTLLNLVAGIDMPQQGEISVCDTPLHRLDDAARRDFRITRIGFVFQNFELLDYLDVLDNILHPYRISSALKLDAGVRARARDLAQRMGLGDRLSRHSEALSQGERQRAANDSDLPAETCGNRSADHAAGKFAEHGTDGRRPRGRYRAARLRRFYR